MATPEERAAVLMKLDSCPHPATIVELGAYDGSDTRWLTRGGNRACTIVLVEPDERNLDKLFALRKEISMSRTACLIYAGAIAATGGMAGFYPCSPSRMQGPASGSIRKPTGHVEHFPEITFSDPAKVAGITLDQLHACFTLRSIDLLWVDIQGAERDMILGGGEALRRTRYMFIEAEQVELYEGQALRPELLSMLPGWVVRQDFRNQNLLLENMRCEP